MVGGKKGWLGWIILAVLFWWPATLLAIASEVALAIDQDGRVLLDGQSVESQFFIDPREEVIVFPFPLSAPPTDSLTVLLTLPFTMPAEWQPRLIPSKCQCQTHIERETGQTFRLSVTGLQPGAAVSLEATFPPGTFHLSFAKQVIFGLEQASPWILSFGLLVLIASLGFLGWMVEELISIRKFRFVPESITHPPNLIPPAILSLIPSGKITSTTFAALLASLLERGYVTIYKDAGKFRFEERRPIDLTGRGFAVGSLPPDHISDKERAKADAEGLTMAEKFFLAKLFTSQQPVVTEHDLKTRFGHRLSSWKIGKVYAELYRQVTEAGYFIANPHHIHLRYRGIGIGLFLGGFLGFLLTFLLPGERSFLQLAWVLVCLVGYVITRMVPFLPLLTVSGQAEWVRWAAFHAYLNHKSPLSSRIPARQFIDYLPYALAFGILPAWAARFGDRTVRLPAWYKASPSTQKITDVAKDLNHLVNFVARYLATIHEHTIE